MTGPFGIRSDMMRAVELISVGVLSDDQTGNLIKRLHEIAVKSKKDRVVARALASLVQISRLELDHEKHRWKQLKDVMPALNMAQAHSGQQPSEIIDDRRPTEVENVEVDEAGNGVFEAAKALGITLDLAKDRD